MQADFVPLYCTAPAGGLADPTAASDAGAAFWCVQRTDAGHFGANISVQ